MSFIVMSSSEDESVESFGHSLSYERSLSPFRKMSDDESFKDDSGDEFDFEGITRRPFRDSVGREFTYCNLDHFYQVVDDDLYFKRRYGLVSRYQMRKSIYKHACYNPVSLVLNRHVFARCVFARDSSRLRSFFTTF